MVEKYVIDIKEGINVPCEKNQARGLMPFVVGIQYQIISV